MAKVGEIISCRRCGGDVVVTNPNMKFCSECSKLKRAEYMKKRCAKVKENKKCTKERKISLVDMENEAREKKTTYGKLRGQEYLKTIPSVLDGWNH